MSTHQPEAVAWAERIMNAGMCGYPTKPLFEQVPSELREEVGRLCTININEPPPQIVNYVSEYQMKPPKPT